MRWGLVIECISHLTLAIWGMFWFTLNWEKNRPEKRQIEGFEKVTISAEVCMHEAKE